MHQALIEAYVDRVLVAQRPPAESAAARRKAIEDFLRASLDGAARVEHDSESLVICQDGVHPLTGRRERCLDVTLIGNNNRLLQMAEMAAAEDGIDVVTATVPFGSFESSMLSTNLWHTQLFGMSKSVGQPRRNDNISVTASEEQRGFAADCLVRAIDAGLDQVVKKTQIQQLVEQAFDEHLRGSRGRSVVALNDDGTLVGHAVAEEAEDPRTDTRYARVIDVFVESGHLGEGWSTALAEGLESWACLEGLPHMEATAVILGDPTAERLVNGLISTGWEPTSTSLVKPISSAYKALFASTYGARR